ncbi:MAG: YhcH/YjgK/YiaL family protein [Muribaculum sp.]|nr:YhcH/YjgK/YiaL family protein [Muribaculum sp.]
MILCELKNAGRYASISPAISLALTWLTKHFNDPFKPGTASVGITPGGKEIYAKFEEPALLPREKVSLEAHREYIDIQLPLKGSEKMGWAPVAGLKLPRGAYDEANDIVFYGDAATTLINVVPGQLAIFFPEDAHAPNIGLGTHRKIIVKIPVE